MLNTVFSLAMAAQPAAEGQQQSPVYFWGVMILMMLIFYVLMIRPQQRKEKERRSMIDNIKSGDKVVFSGGIIGIVSNIKENVFVVKIADNVKIEIGRSAVTQVLEKGDAPQADAGK
jgi:preprotein translocase subunit YajC